MTDEEMAEEVYSNLQTAWADGDQIGFPDEQNAMEAHDKSLIAEALRKVRQDERERCAKVAYDHVCSKECTDRGLGGDCSAVIAQAIRRLE